MRIAISLLAALLSGAALADPFTEEDVERWQQHYEESADRGRELWTDPALGTNGVACAQCHPNAANTHPETYPKFQKQLGRVAQTWEMVNWCIRNPLQGEELAPGDERMTDLLSYIMREREGVELDPGRH